MTRRDGREAEGGGLLNRYTVEKSYRGFESLSLRQYSRHFCEVDTEWLIVLQYGINNGDTNVLIQNIAIAVVVVLVAIIGYYTLKPKATTPAAKPAISAPAQPAAPAKK